MQARTTSEAAFPWLGAALSFVRGNAGLVFGALVLLLSGGLWGYFAWWTHIDHVPGLHRLEWSVELEDGNRTPLAHWISVPGRPLLGYYRKVFNGPRSIRSAWIQISAPYSFNLYVNGRPVGFSFYKSHRATAVFDIARFLEPGENTIAISNTSRTFDENSRILVAGAIENWQGRVTPILSNGSWRAYDRYAREIHRTSKPEWFYPNFEGSNWPTVEVREAPEPDDVARESFPPRVLSKPPPVGWIWSEQAAAGEVFFRRTIRARGKVREAWVRIAARHSYTLFVNGYRIADEVGGIVDSPNQTALDIFDISPYLGRGKNVIAVKVRRGTLDHGFVADGFWTDRRGTHELQTRSGDWLVNPRYERHWTRTGFDDRRWQEATPLRTDTPAASLGFLKTIQDESLPPRDFTRMRRLGIAGSCLAGGLLFLCLGWLALRRGVGTGAGLNGLGAMGVASLFPAALLTLIWLIGYDVRFDPSFSFQAIWVWLAFLLLLASLGIVVLLARTSDGAVPAVRIPRAPWSIPGFVDFVRANRFACLLVLLVVIALAIRLQHIAFETIGADEIKMLAKSTGIMELGFPHVIVAQELGVRLSVTSELVHYPMSWAILAFGENEIALRLPGVLFSIATVVLLFRFGQILHSRTAGLLAAAAFALLPSVVRMSQLARYPSQLSFFTVLTVYLFWRWMSREDVSNRYLWYTTLSYIATYLTWEGSGFLIPSLLLGFLITRPKDLRKTLTNPHLVGCVFFVALVILLQLNIRAMVAGGLYIYGTGTSELTLVPTWNHSNFDLLFYFDNFFLIENHQVLSWLFFLGIPLAFLRMSASRGLRFLYAVSFMNLFMKTCWLQIRNWRYTYNLLPILCLVAAVVVLTLFQALRGVAKRSGGLSPVALRLHGVITWVAVGLLLLSSSAFVLQLYEMPGTHGLPRTRLEDRYYPTIHEAVAYMDQHMQDDDIIISPIPHLVDFYIRDADYFLETILHFQVFLNPTYDTTMHRVSGTQAILSYEELQSVVADNRRVWFVTSPLDEKLLDDRTHNWINENMECVYENVASLVYFSEK